MADWVHRPLDGWPSTVPPLRNPARRDHSRFRAGVQDTRWAFADELRRHRATDAVMFTSHRPGQLRRDGSGPRADATHPPDHPGVVVTFHSREAGQDLTFGTDKFTTWSDNFRGVVLAIEALRAVERYGVTSGIGAQFVGFGALPPGGGAIVADAVMGPDEAADYLSALDAEIDADVAAELLQDVAFVKETFARLAKVHHPDKGGDAEIFQRVKRARDALVG